jgi:hypothetical protein
VLWLLLQAFCSQVCVWSVTPRNTDFKISSQLFMSFPQVWIPNLHTIDFSSCGAHSNLCFNMSLPSNGRHRGASMTPLFWLLGVLSQYVELQWDDQF